MSHPNQKLKVCGWVLCLLWGFQPVVHAQRGPVVKVAEQSLRKITVSSVMPQYPEQSKRQGIKGTAVSEIIVNGRGDVSHLEVLEAPDQFIKQAVTDAVNQWKFKPTILDGNPVNLKGKLTFYFVIDERGDVRVENPKQFK